MNEHEGEFGGIAVVGSQLQTKTRLNSTWCVVTTMVRNPIKL
jgi:hypothetical protein